MGLFFIDTDTGQIATQAQLSSAGLAGSDGIPARPWLRVQGSGDSTTLWHAVMRKQERGVYIGTLVLRHSSHHDLLLQRGWQDVPVEEIGVPGTAGAPRAPAPGPFSE
jgi:hypothetical protein